MKWLKSIVLVLTGLTGAAFIALSVLYFTYKKIPERAQVISVKNNIYTVMEKVPEIGLDPKDGGRNSWYSGKIYKNFLLFRIVYKYNIDVNEELEITHYICRYGKEILFFDYMPGKSNRRVSQRNH